MNVIVLKWRIMIRHLSTMTFIFYLKNNYFALAINLSRSSWDALNKSTIIGMNSATSCPVAGST